MTDHTIQKTAALAALALTLSSQPQAADAKEIENGDGPVVKLTMHDGLDRGPIIDTSATGQLPSLGCNGPDYSGEINVLARDEWAFSHPYMHWTPYFDAQSFQGNPYLEDTAYFFGDADGFTFTLTADDVSNVHLLQVRIREWTRASDYRGPNYDPDAETVVYSDIDPHYAVQSHHQVTTGSYQSGFYSYNEQWLTLDKPVIGPATLDFSVNSLGRDGVIYVYATDGKGNETMAKVVLAPEAMCVER